MAFGCDKTDAPKTDTVPDPVVTTKPAPKQSDSKSLVGTWHVKADKPDGADLDLVLKSDQSMTWSSKQKVDIEGKPIDLEMVMPGTWSSTDKDLTVTFTDVKIKGVSPELAKSQEEPLKAGLNKPMAGPYTWKGDKQVEFTIGGQTATYTLVDKN